MTITRNIITGSIVASLMCSSMFGVANAQNTSINFSDKSYYAAEENLQDITGKIQDTSGSEITSNLSALKDGESYTFISNGRSHTVEMHNGNFVLVGEAMMRASICATTVATVIFGIGSAALFAAAAAMAPGSVLVLGGLSFTSGQVAALAGAAGSFAAVEAYLDSKFCR